MTCTKAPVPIGTGGAISKTISARAGNCYRPDASVDYLGAEAEIAGEKISSAKAKSHFDVGRRAFEASRRHRQSFG
jgi:hypothetical protein